ncbi:hypothetical protein K469DRAFT_806552 [Zopfia rhizophila CBS 207.26]|uniref:HAD-like protein n=1 Tax=Zopfia rhizophila CBS 207.26 TaxID=1314779 RepID=A0A6A6DH16_9PEZI|nr:hypothetical protein K469DRAFT_806552 [Zopfia rhizophila CBS 207.26]
MQRAAVTNPNILIPMEPTCTSRVVLFDLDNTLFDYYYSLRSKISAIQEKYPSLAGIKLEELITRYNTALQIAYNKYLDEHITYEETDVMKVQLFFRGLDLLNRALRRPWSSVLFINRCVGQIGERRREVWRYWSGCVNMAILSPLFRMTRLKTKRQKLRLSECVISLTAFSPLRKQDVASQTVAYFNLLWRH